MTWRVKTAGLAAAALAVSATAADWPQWRGPARTGEAPGLTVAWPDALRTAWKVGVGVGHASPVVAGGVVYLFSRHGDEEVLEALDLATGRRRWRQAVAAPYSMSMAAYSHGKGPKSTPLVADGRVYTFGISGILSAHDAASGRLQWRKTFAGEYPETWPGFGTAQSPLLDEGRLVVHVGGDDGGAVTAFDAGTGAVRWTWNGDTPAYASPVVLEAGESRQVVTFTKSRLVGLEARTGRLLWSLPLATSYDQNAVTPVVHDNVVIFSGLDHPLKAVRLVHRGGRWHPQILWENAEVAAYMSTPVVAAGRLVGLSHRRKGQFYALDLRTGRTLWLSGGRQGENAALIAAGSDVLAQTTEGEVLVIDAAAPSYQVKRRYSVADGATWAHPALTAEGLMVKDVDTLALLKF